MTAAAISELDQAPTANARLVSWVREITELTGPERVAWTDNQQGQLTHPIVHRSSLCPATPARHHAWESIGYSQSDAQGRSR